MPITRCPGCEQQLEVPVDVPGGLVACPYCATEFPVGGGSRGPAATPIHARHAADRSRRRGRMARDDEEGRPAYRRRSSNAMPIIVVVVTLLVFGGVGLFFYLKSQKQAAAREAERLAAIAAIGPEHVDFNRAPDNPTGDPWKLTNRFVVGDRIHLRTLTQEISLNRSDLDNPIFDLMIKVVSEKDAEKVVSLDGDHAKHVGRYTVTDYIVNGAFMIPGHTDIEAEFKTDGLGRLVQGSFRQTGGTTLNPIPQIIGDRSFGYLPGHPVRAGPVGRGQPGETWGTSTLPDPISSRLMIGGRAFTSIPLHGSRRGGWRIEGGTISRNPDRSMDRRASLNLKLSAAENRYLQNGTYEGRPAEISGYVHWTGKATYMLRKKLMVHVEGIYVRVVVQAKMKERIVTWNGSYKLAYRIVKDP